MEVEDKVEVLMVGGVVVLVEVRGPWLGWMERGCYGALAARIEGGWSAARESREELRYG